MKLEHQVTSLEVSKRLRELGVKQESLFRYYKYHLKHEPMLMMSPPPEVSIATLSGNLEYEVSAFTVAELGEMLPDDTKSWKFKYDSNEELFEGWVCEALQHEHEKAKTEADARGKMLIYLIENNLIKL